MSSPEKDPIRLGLPHRNPFIFIDEVLFLDSRESRCRKVFPSSDPLFLGHFPDNPIVPGVLLTEGLAQAAGLIAGYSSVGPFLLSAIRNMKFPAAAKPEEEILFHAEKMGEMGSLWQFAVRATADLRLVAEGQVILNRVSAAS